MPTGKVINPSGPDNAQGELGQVQDIDGNIYLFHNTASLKKHEPVLFDFEQYHLKLHGNILRIPVAVLEMEDGQPAIAKNPWSDKFKKRWVDEWGGQSEERIIDLDIKSRKISKANSR